MIVISLRSVINQLNELNWIKRQLVESFSLTNEFPNDDNGDASQM